MNDQLAQMIGPQSSDSGLRRRMRFHQGWWRAFVLSEEPGLHPSDSQRRICSTVLNGEETGSNFLSPRILEAVRLTLAERGEDSRGFIEEDRLFNNLLSSQPFAFNLLGELKLDPDYAASVLGALFPGVIRVSNTIFEFAPATNYTADNSAFDVAFEVESQQGKGLIGLECKFTDNFSQEEYDKPEYREIYEKSQSFTVDYAELITSEFNQLFRNQLMSEALVLNGAYGFSIAGLLCHPEDEEALDIARQFKSFLRDGDKFRILTYWDVIEAMQRTDVTGRQREYIMLLWARYLGTQLSNRAFERVG